MKAILLLICITAIFAQGPIGGGDHDKVAQKVIALNQFLGEKEVGELREYVLKIENWRSEEKKELFIGKFPEIVNKLDKEGCIKYIIAAAIKYTELLELPFFKNIAGPEHSHFLPEDKPIGGGLHDFIFRLPRETLNNFALSCERFIQEKRGAKILGGLHDSLRLMADQDVAKYILDRTKDYPELDNYANLQKLSVDYGFAPKQTSN
jgi:hypothetical protein